MTPGTKTSEYKTAWWTSTLIFAIAILGPVLEGIALQYGIVIDINASMATAGLAGTAGSYTISRGIVKARASKAEAGEKTASDLLNQMLDK